MGRRQSAEPTWPEWAEQCLKIIRRHSGENGSEDAEGVDLPAELEEMIDEFNGEIARLKGELSATNGARNRKLRPITAKTDVSCERP